MEKLLLILTFLITFSAVHSQERTADFQYLYFLHQYDSILIYGEKLQKTDKKLAKKESVDYYIALSNLTLKKYNLGIEQGNEIIRKTSSIANTRLKRGNNMLARDICLRLFEFYKSKQEYREASKYLIKVDRKFQVHRCGTIRLKVNSMLYLDLIDCYQKLNKPQKVKKYQKKLDKL